jgi:hypothetical protein
VGEVTITGGGGQFLVIKNGEIIVSFLVSPELSKIAMREGLESAFVAWSILRDYVVAKKHSSHFTKKTAARILAQNGMKFSSRHYGRIWQEGAGIFWHLEERKLHMTSFARVAGAFEAFRKPCDFSVATAPYFVQISLSGGIEDLRAKLYFAWFAQFEEKTISRDTLRDLFGISHDQQRAYEAILGPKLLVKSNYAHINSETYAESPEALPEHHFTIKFEREISLNRDAKDSPDTGMQEITAYQYQLPNTFIARHEDNQEFPVPHASNRARNALRSLDGPRDYPSPLKRLYWLNRRHFERFGSLESFVRAYYQGKKRLWLSGHYF